MRSILLATFVATCITTSLGSQLTARLLRKPSRAQSSFVNAAQQSIEGEDAFAYYESLFERVDDIKQQKVARDEAEDDLVVDYSVEEVYEEPEEWTFA